MVGSHLDLKSRSPKSLQSKNTKKLSLNISQEGNGSHSVVMIEPPGSPWKQREPRRTRGQSFKQARSEAQIYTLPLVSPGAEAFDVPSETEAYKRHDETIHRGQSLKLTIETGSLPAVPPVGLGRLRMRSLSSSNTALYESAGKRDAMQQEFCGETLSWVFHKSDTPLEQRRPLVFSNGAGVGQDKEEEEDNEVDSFSPSLHSYVDVLNGSVYMGEPLCVIEPNIFLYSEPTLEQVLNFDLVINVAKEITNFAPQIPAGSSTQYYHFKWSHTSKICINLEEITQLMHDAVRRNKRVLVHCQCGVSRSASLIVGYIMRYQSLSLNDAYNHLKKIAKYISPNMNLIFQLLEWGDRLKNGGINNGTTKSCYSSSSPSSSEEKPELLDDGLDSRDDMSKPSLSSPNGSSVLSTETTPRTPRDFMSSTLSTSFTPNVGSVGTTSPIDATNETKGAPGVITENQSLGLKKDTCVQCSLVLSTYSRSSSDIVNDNWRNI